ncbi:hypothetical protein MMC18_003773 [Xylographa bjoerkii]|nr:hypothetical protein [Xylographa bjoerkii]
MQLIANTIRTNTHPELDKPPLRCTLFPPTFRSKSPLLVTPRTPPATKTPFSTPNGHLIALTALWQPQTTPQSQAVQQAQPQPKPNVYFSSDVLPSYPPPNPKKLIAHTLLGLAPCRHFTLLQDAPNSPTRTNGNKPHKSTQRVLFFPNAIRSRCVEARQGQKREDSKAHIGTTGLGRARTRTVDRERSAQQ